MSEIELNEIVTRLNGAIFRKAEMHENYLEFYTNIFERLAIFSFSEGADILELFGNMGG